jgi:CheY-like chemotaxis protein
MTGTGDGGDLRRQLADARTVLDRLAERLDHGDGDDLREELAALAARLTRMAVAPAAPAAAPHPAPPSRRGRVLLIDDEPLAVDCITEYLDGRGYDVLPAGTPRDALALASRRVIDVVVTDLRMPGMDGGQLVAELRKSRPGLPAVVVTGHLVDRIDGTGGPVVVMRKPLALDQLEAAIATLLAGAPAEPPT